MEKLVLAVDGAVREFMVTDSKLRMIKFECYQNIVGVHNKKGISLAGEAYILSKIFKWVLRSYS